MDGHACRMSAFAQDGYCDSNPQPGLGFAVYGLESVWVLTGYEVRITQEKVHLPEECCDQLWLGEWGGRCVDGHACRMSAFAQDGYGA